MTEYQLQAAQAAIDCITAVAPAAFVLALGGKLLHMAMKFLTGRKL